MSELIKKMFETYPGAVFPDNEEAFVKAAEKLGFAESDIKDALVELSQMIIDEESFDAIAGGVGTNFPPPSHNTRVGGTPLF